MQFLTYLPPELVKRIRTAAIDRGEHAYHFVERELKDALDRRKEAAYGSPIAVLTDLSDEVDVVGAPPDTEATGKESS